MRIATLRATAGAARRRVLSFPDRLLHSSRRERALRRLGQADAPHAVLFVCYGNICRSPYGERSLRAALAPPGPPLRVGSAGLHGPGRRPPGVALEEAAARGHDLGDHRSRLVSPADPSVWDLWVVMDADQQTRVRSLGGPAGDALVLGDLDPLPIRARGIADPWGRPRAVYAEVFDRIDRCVAVLAAAIAGRRRTTAAEEALRAR